MLFPLCGFASLNYDLEGSAAAAEGGQGVGASYLDELGGGCCWEWAGGAAE